MTLEVLSSPLKVVTKKTKFVATDSSGGVVIDGTSGGDDALTCTTAGGAIRISHRVKEADAKYYPVFDATGRQVARIETHMFKHWQVVLPSGESIAATSGHTMITGHGSKFGDLAVSKAPWLAPQRYFKMTLSDALLARPDREMLAVVAAWIAEINISASISASASSSSG